MSRPSPSVDLLWMENGKISAVAVFLSLLFQKSQLNEKGTWLNRKNHRGPGGGRRGGVYVCVLCYIIWIIISLIDDTSGSAEPFHIPHSALDIWQTYASGSRRGEGCGGRDRFHHSTDR